MKKFLCTMALAMTLCNVLFAQEVKVGDPCKNGQSVCPPSNDGTLYGEAEKTGEPTSSYYEYTCEYWTENIDTAFNGCCKNKWKNKIQEAVKDENKLKQAGLSYDKNTKQVKCKTETKTTSAYPYDSNNKVIGCNNSPDFTIDGVKFGGDCKVKKVINLKNVISGTQENVLRQTNLSYDGEIQGYANLSKQNDVMNGKNYVNGDYAVTANSVLKYYGDSNYDRAKTSYKKEASFGKNSSKQKISLPPQLKPEDIVFARLYWAGNIHSGQYADTTLKNVVSGGYLNEKAKSKIKSQIQGYREVMIQAENEEPQKFTAEDKDVYFDYSVDYVEGGLYFMYSNSVDVKKYIQDTVKNNSSKFDSANSEVDIEVAVGDIKSMQGDVRQFYNSMVGTHVLTGKYGGYWQGSYGIYIANYGNWSLFVVYDKKASVDSKIKKKFYKPKYVTLYHGMSELMAPNNLKSTMTFNMDGFYTPTSNDYDARVSFFTNQNVGYDTEGKGGFMAFQKNKDKNSGYEKTPVKRGYSQKWLYPGIFVTKAGSADGVEKSYNKRDTGAIGMYTRNVDEFMFGSQTQTSAQFGVSNWSGAGEQSLLTYMAFSTDVYVPRICYAYHVYSSNGEKDNFSAVRGDKIRTIIKFKNEVANGEKSEKATGVIANFVMDSNNSYIINSLILNNKTSSNKTFKEYKEKVDKIPENGASNIDFAFLKDNEKGAYKNKARTNKFSYGIYHDRMLNNVVSEKIKKIEYQRVVEYDKDDKDKKSPQITIKPIEVTYDTTKVKLAIGKDIKDYKEFVGGDLDVGEQVFTEYESILGDRYVQNKFTLDFAQVINGQKIEYKDQEIDECQPDPGDTHGEKIKVIPLNGLRVVNQNVTQNDVDNALDKITGKLKDSFNSHLYTQIGGKEFKANLVYTPDISRSVTMNADGTVTVWGEDGKSSKTMSYEEFIAQATKDTKFNSYGVVYLSLIPKETLLNKKECKDLTIGMYKSSGTPIIGSDTVPFYYDSFPKSVQIGTGTPNEMSQEVNRNYSKNHPHPSYAVDFNGKNFLALDKLKVDYDMNNYTFVVSYAPYKVANQKDFEDGKEDSKTSDAVKQCQKEYDAGYTDCSSKSANFCSVEKNQKNNGGSYSSCLVKQNQSCLAKVSKTYQNCIGGSKEVIKDAVVNKQGLFNVCASDNFAVRPKFIRYVGENLPRYKAGIKMSESFQRFKAENEDGKPAYGYNVVLNDTYSGDGSLDGAKILEQNTGKDDYKPYDPKSQFSISAIAPVLPRNCNVNNVTGISSDGKINSNLWKNSGMRLGADFRLRSKDSNVIDQANISRLEDEELNKYRNSVRPAGGKYELDSKYDKYGYVYTTPNANNDLDKGKNQKTMSLEYYNIGWAGFTLVDNKWTTHDQAGDCVEDDKGRFSNKPTTVGKDAGRVGCSIGLVVDKPIKGVNKDEQKWVYAAFDYDRVDVDLLDLKDAFNQTDDTQGKLQNDASRPVNFTYFYNGDIDVAARSGYIGNGNLNPTENGMGATMRLKSTARLATQANVDGKTESALYFGINSTKSGVETKTVNGTAVKRGIIPTLFNENCYAQTVTFDMDNRYMPKNATTNANNDPAGLDRNNNVILESSRNWTYGNFVINTMFVQGQANKTNFDTALTKPFQMLNTGFANGVNNGNFYINFLKSNLVESSTGGGTGARNPLIIVAEDFHASADLDVCADPKACVIPATNTTPTYDPEKIFNSFANGSDRRIQAVATTSNPSYYYNAIDRKTTPLNATNLATNPVGVARFYYGNFNNAQVRPVGTQQLNVASSYFIQPMIYCEDRVADRNACFNTDLFPLFGLAAGQNVANLVIDAGQRPNFYLNRAFTYGDAGGLDITNKLRTNYVGGTSSVAVRPNNMLLATGNQKNYSEQITVTISGGAGTTQEVRIFVKPWFLSDYSNANLDYNRFFVNAAGGAAWAGAGGVKEDKAKKRELQNVGSFLNDTDVTTDGNSKNRTNRITW